MTEQRPQDDEALRPQMSEFGNIVSAIQIRGALEAIAGKSRTYILFKDKSGNTYPIPRIRFEWHELMIVVDITFLSIGGWAFDLQPAHLCSEEHGGGIPLNPKMADLMGEALEALQLKMQTKGGMFKSVDT